MDFWIRLLEGKDLFPESGTIRTLSSLTSAPDLSEEKIADAWGFISKESSAVFVAETNVDLKPRIIGILKLVFDYKLYHGGRFAGRIEDVAIDQDFQGQGIGSALIKAAITRAKKLDCYKVTLTCRPERLAFYEKHGFHYHDWNLRYDFNVEHQ